MEASGTWEIHRCLGRLLGQVGQPIGNLLRKAEAVMEVGLAHTVLGAWESHVHGEGARQSETELEKH
jgi:hypothetical protein